MNKLKISQQEQALTALVEGNSIRSVERLTGCHRDTIMRLMVRVGEGCERLMDERLRGLTRCKKIQVDELWGYIGKKQGRLKPEDDHRAFGDTWTFIALCSDTKLIPAHYTGERNAWTTQMFMSDLASRLECRIQLSTDALRYYTKAVELAFGGAIDYGRQVKQYRAVPAGTGRYSPPRVKSTHKSAVQGRPNWDDISTSFVERHNLSMRMCIRRLTRLTNGYSKKLRNHRAMVALYLAHYNFVRRHGTLRMTPCMAADVTDRFWDVLDLIAYADSHA